MIKFKTTAFVLIACLLTLGKSLEQEFEDWEEIVNGFYPIKSCRVDHSETFILKNSNLVKLDEKEFRAPKMKCLDVGGNKIHEITKGFFTKVPNLRLINLENNAILIDGFFQTFHSNLLNIETLNLDNNKGTTFLKITGIYPKLKHLYLRNLGLSDFEFSLSSSLTHLYLSGNEVSKGSTFKIPESVTHLFLNKNNLGKLPTDQVPKLKVLSVSENFFEKIGCTEKPRVASLCLRKFQNLERLFLGGNDIFEIELSAFDGISNLVTLDLSSNHIEKLEPNTFNKLSTLRSLNLSSNPLTEVPKLCELRNLEVLILDHTRIMGVEEDKFCDLKKLKQLWLNDAGITRISLNSFGNLISLEELNLSENKLSTLEEWQIPFSLRRLILQGNLFKSLGEATKIGPAFLEYLDLRRNPIKEVEVRSFNISRLNIDL